MTELAKITAMDNGPFLIKGPLTVTDAQGNEFQTERKTVALCRCGESTNKPFCDGAHAEMGFRAQEKAVRDDRNYGEQAG